MTEIVVSKPLQSLQINTTSVMDSITKFQQNYNKLGHIKRSVPLYDLIHPHPSDLLYQSYRRFDPSSALFCLVSLILYHYGVFKKKVNEVEELNTTYFTVVFPTPCHLVGYIFNPSPKRFITKSCVYHGSFQISTTDNLRAVQIRRSLYRNKENNENQSVPN